MFLTAFLGFSSNLNLNRNFDRGRDLHGKDNFNPRKQPTLKIRLRGNSRARSTDSCDVLEEIKDITSLGNQISLPFGLGDDYDTYPKLWSYGSIVLRGQSGLGSSGTFMSKNNFDADLLCGYDDYWCPALISAGGRPD